MTHQERIASLRSSIVTDEQAIAELRIKRTALLTTDDDSAIGKIDTEIERLQRRIGLSQERIAATEQAERDAAQQAHEQHLDALAAKAEKARGIGTALLQDYAKHAGALAAVLAKLTALDELITESNRTLAAAGRTTIASPNDTRCRPMSYASRTERRQVGIGQHEHPMHGKAGFDMNGRCVDHATGEPVESFVEVDVTTREIVPAINLGPLQDTVVLPEASQGGTTIWPPRAKVDSHALALELGLGDQPAGPIKKLLGRVVG